MPRRTPENPDRGQRILRVTRGIIGIATTAWVETLREPTHTQAEKIDKAMDEVVSEELGRPLKGPEKLAADRAARFERLDAMDQKNPGAPPPAPK